jgi:4-amino-4-deoxy-L-arabinose transferase-like glycosyltransferase
VEGGREKGTDQQRRIVLALLVLLVSAHLLINWLWRLSNQVVYGFDRMFHQVTSLAYYDLLRESVGLRSLFEALTWSDYYPPLVHLTAVGFYKLFGVSMDVAALSNSVYLIALLLAVFGIAEKLAGPWAGLLSAAVVSTLPIVFSMSRYLYIDFALTALVAANLCLLLRSDRFGRRGYALLYGLSLGLGMLTKWTFVVFAAPPLVVVLATPGLLRAAGRRLAARQTGDGRRMVMAGLLGLALTGLWFLPNVEATAALPLGYALVPLSWLLWTAASYFGLTALTARPDRGANLLAALALGLAVASSWYLTKINFFETFWLNAYGKPTGRSWGFGQYLDFLYREQLSPLYAALLLVALAGLGWRRWRRTHSWRGMLALGVEGWALVAWAMVPYVVFSSRVSIVHSRYIMPLLPPLGIAIALWLAGLKRRWLRGLLIGLVALAATLQFAALSFDALAGWQARLPILAQGLSIQLPASGRTDAGYWVVPDVLEYTARRRPAETTRLGVLVNAYQVNSKHFIYLAYAQYPGVQIDELATIGWEVPVYPRLFEEDFVLSIDPVPHYARRPDTEATMARLVGSEEDTFHRAFDLAQTYPLPDGRRLLLYERRFDGEEGETAYYEALAADLAVSGAAEDAVIALPPEQVYALGRQGGGDLEIYPLPAEPGGAVSEVDLALLARLSAEHGRLWVVLGDLQGADPAGLTSRRLAERFYGADHRWYGPLQLTLYAPPADGIGDEFRDGEARAAGTRWENGIELAGYRFVEEAVPVGQIARLDLRWRAEVAPAGDYKVFVQLLDGEGRLAAQRDSEPLDGLRPTSGWQAGETVEDRQGLWLTGQAPFGAPLAPGDYRLVLGLYDAGTGERLAVCCSEGDSVVLAEVRIEGSMAYFK